MEFECGEACGFGVGFCCDGVGFVVAELLDGEVQGAGVDGFERDSDIDRGGFLGRLPLGFD